MFEIRTLALIVGGLIALLILLIWVWRTEHDDEFYELLNKQLNGIQTTEAQTRRKTNWSYRKVLYREALIINQPERAEIWYRTSLIACIVPILMVIFFQQIAALLLIPLIIYGTVFFAQETRKNYVRTMQRQTRFAKMVIAFLMKAGSSLSGTLGEMEATLDDPIRSRLAEVNLKKKFTTLPNALTALAKSTGVTELKDFAVIVSESEAFGTPVAESLMKSLNLESKLRKARAAQRRGDIQVKLGMYATVGIAVPGFGFVLYAMVSYIMRLLSASWF